MKKGHGKLKGGDFERRVCRMLTKWITGKEKPEIFWRSAGSGAKATVDSKKGIDGGQHGDIVPVAKEGLFFTDQFIIECKSYKNFDITKIISDKKSLVQTWWEQVSRDAQRARKMPLLIFKKNFGEPLIAMNQYLLVSDGDWVGDSNLEHISVSGLDIFNFQQWLDSHDPETIKWRSENA